MYNFKQSLKPKIYSRALRTTPAAARSLQTGSREEAALFCCRPGPSPAVVIWKEFDPPRLSWRHSCPPPPAAPVWLRMEAVWTRSNELVCVMNEKKINFINMCFSWVKIQKAPYWTILGIIELSLLTFALHFQPPSPHLEVDIKKKSFGRMRDGRRIVTSPDLHAI